MIIDFKNIEETRLKHFKGGEKDTIARMFVDEKNRIMYGKLESGSSIGLHIHDTGSEILYILEGTGKVIFDNETFTISKGLCHYCPKGHSHSLINDSNSDLIFFAVVPQQ